jgi:hypothetical protein
MSDMSISGVVSRIVVSYVLPGREKRQRAEDHIKNNNGFIRFKAANDEHEMWYKMLHALSDGIVIERIQMRMAEYRYAVLVIPYDYDKITLLRRRVDDEHTMCLEVYRQVRPWYTNTYMSDSEV